MKPLGIISRAEYLSDYVLKIYFDDGQSRIVDFYPFLSTNGNPMNTQFLDIEAFKKFKVRYGVLYWKGRLGEMDFNADHLPN